MATAYFAYYDSLPADRREQIDATLKVNRFATPSIGQGFTTSSGGANVPGRSRWNFHWGGVVMMSTDGSDRVVLENYAVGDPTVENERWTFEMYGTKKNRTFHEKHQATGQHGATPTTMAIEKK